MKSFNEWVEELNEAKKTKKAKKAKGKDVTGDGKADFADVMASRMIASGVPKKVAIAKSKKYEKK